MIFFVRKNDEVGENLNDGCTSCNNAVSELADRDRRRNKIDREECVLESNRCYAVD